MVYVPLMVYVHIIQYSWLAIACIHILKHRMVSEDILVNQKQHFNPC